MCYKENINKKLTESALESLIRKSLCNLDQMRSIAKNWGKRGVRMKLITAMKGVTFTLVALTVMVGGSGFAHALGIPGLPGIPGLGGMLPGGGLAFGAGGCGGTTMGSVMCNVVDSSYDLPAVIAGFAYMFGLVLAFWGIIKLKEHVINPNQTPLSDAVKRFIAGGAFFALPIVTEAAYNTVADGIIDSAETGFNTPGTTGMGLDAMITAMMADIWTPVHNLIAAFAYLAGLVLIVVGISRLLKSAQEGPRGPGGFGTIMTFLVGGALLSVDAMMGAFNSSLFMTPDVATYAELSFSAGLTGPELDHIHNVISAVLAFLMVIGWISFVRGWFIIREVAEGSQQASLMAGMTHIFGGALAVNLGPVLNAVQDTFGITGYGITFT